MVDDVRQRRLFLRDPLIPLKVKVRDCLLAKIYFYLHVY